MGSGVSNLLMNSISKYSALAVSILMVAGALVLPITLSDHSASAISGAQVRAGLSATAGLDGEDGYDGAQVATEEMVETQATVVMLSVAQAKAA